MVECRSGDLRRRCQMTPQQSSLIRMLENSYADGTLTRREFVTGLATALGLLTFGGSAVSAVAAAENRADLLDSRATAKHGGTLKVAITGQPDQLDPGTDNTYASFQIMANIFDTLVT